MKTATRTITAWLVGAAAAIALAGCHPGVAAGSRQPASTLSTPAGRTVAATPSSTNGSDPSAAAAQQSSDLAGVRSDLAGIDAGNSQADVDESAGDSARAQDDNN